MSCSVRFVCINDVYEIDYLPHFSTCVKGNKAKDSSSNKTIAVLPGDFVAPSLLSSLDKGAGMVRCLNLSNLDYVAIGNHESDIELNQLHCRMRESTFKWINSNMPDLPLPEDIKLPRYEIIELQHGSSVKKIALVGLCGEDRSVMKAGAFGDCLIEPILDISPLLYKEMMEKEGVHCVVPMTHQYIHMDRKLAQAKVGFPVILGGHDHDPFVEEIEGCTIVKSGMDGTKIAEVDLSWPEGADRPIVAVVLKDYTEFEKDPIVELAVRESKQILVELEKSVLCPIPADVHLSSVGMRMHPTTVGSFLCSAVRDATNADCCLIGAGSIRAKKSYLQHTHFTYADLKSELPFDTMVAVVELPGHLVEDMITYTRGFALQEPPVAKGGYIQTDAGVEWSSESNEVTKIGGQPVQKEGIYRVAMNTGMLLGLDDVQPLIQYMASLPKEHPIKHVCEEGSSDAKCVVVSHFAKKLIFDIVHNCHDLEQMDTNHDRNISKEELRQYLRQKDSGMSQAFTDLLINNLFAVCDLDHNDQLSLIEILGATVTASLSMRSSTLFGGGEKDICSVSDCVNALEKAFADTVFASLGPTLTAMAENIDEDGNGYISKKEFKDFCERNTIDFSQICI